MVDAYPLQMPVTVEVDGETQTAKAGDYLVIHPGGRQEIVPKAEFEAEYDELKMPGRKPAQPKK
jgi:D-lyxose ketol-isomerase